MGVFTMSPQSGQDYRAEVTASDGRKLRTQLPTVKEDGYAIVVSQSPREIRYKIAAAPGSTCDSMTLVTHVRGICTAIVSVDSGNLIGGWPTDSLPEGNPAPDSARTPGESPAANDSFSSLIPTRGKYGRSLLINRNTDAGNRFTSGSRLPMPTRFRSKQTVPSASPTAIP